MWTKDRAEQQTFTKASFRGLLHALPIALPHTSLAGLVREVRTRAKAGKTSAGPDPAPKMALLPLSLRSRNQTSNGLGGWGGLSSGFKVNQLLTSGLVSVPVLCLQKKLYTDPHGSDLSNSAGWPTSDFFLPPLFPLVFTFPSLTNFSGPSHRDNIREISLLPVSSLFFDPLLPGLIEK